MFTMKHTSKMRAAAWRGMTLALGAVLAIGATAPRALADLETALDAASGDAEIVIVIPSMRDFSDALAQLNDTLGINEPDLADALGEFKRDMGFTEGLDDDGPALIVFNDLGAKMMDALENNGGDEPEPIILLPVSDYGSFVGQLGGDAGGVTQVQFEYEEGFAKEMAGYAVMGESAAVVEAYASGDAGAALLEQAGKFAGAAGEDALAVVYVDMAKLAPALEAAIDRGVQEATEATARAKEQGQDPFAMGPMAGADMGKIMWAYGSLGKTLVQGMSRLVITADYDDAGLGFDYAVKMVPDSKLASYFTGQRNDATALLSQMPDQPWIFASSWDMSAVDMAQLSKDMIAGLKEAFGENAMMAAAMQNWEQQLGLYEQMNAAAQVFYAPNQAAMMTGGFLNTLNVYDVDDAPAAIAAYKQSIEAMPDMFAGLDGPMEGMNANVSYTPNALTLDGHDVDQYQVNFVLPPELMAELGPMAFMMGNMGYGGYITAVDGKLLMTTVADPQLITRGIESLGQDDGVGASAALRAVRDEQLPEDLVMDLFVSFGGIAEAVSPFAMMMGGMQLNVPEGMPPLAVGLGLEGEAMGARVFVPTEVMTFIKDTISDVQGMGQQAGAGGGAPPAPY